MIEDILAVKETGDTCGGVVEVIVHGVPAGLGEPVFDKLSATIAHGLMSIGAVKGLEFGAGFGVADMLGSECNDETYVNKETGRVNFYSNNAGGILGGISNGDEIRLRVAVKPTPLSLFLNGQCTWIRWPTKFLSRSPAVTPQFSPGFIPSAKHGPARFG